MSGRPVTDAEFPVLRGVVLDTTDARRLAEGGDDPRGRDWLVVTHPSGLPRLAFQQVADLPASTWPDPGTPQQLHLDFGVPDEAALGAQHERAIGLGAQLLLDRSDDPVESLYVYADPDGHPFCIFVSPG